MTVTNKERVDAARAATTRLRDAARTGRVIDFRERDPLVLAIHRALDLVIVDEWIPEPRMALAATLETPLPWNVLCHCGANALFGANYCMKHIPPPPASPTLSEPERETVGRCFRRCSATYDRRRCADESGLMIVECQCDCHCAAPVSPAEPEVVAAVQRCAWLRSWNQQAACARPRNEWACTACPDLKVRK